MINSGIMIFTSGKGGVGKTPFALAFALTLLELGKKVIALDFNFHNPDLFEILIRLGYNKTDFVDKIEGEKLSPALNLFSLNVGNEEGMLFLSSRVDKYKYTPYPPDHIFKSIIALREKLGEDVFVVVDTNLNIMSFNLVDPTRVVYFEKVLKQFDRLSFNYLLTPSIFARSFGRHGITNDIEQIELTINTFNKFNVELFGKRGENINFILTPTVLNTKALQRGFIDAIRDIIGKKVKRDESLVSVSRSLTSMLDDYISDMMFPYERSTRYLTIKELKEISDNMFELIVELGYNRLEVIEKINAQDVQAFFFSKILDMIYDRETDSLPKNVLFVPFIVTAMINFVDSMLLADNLTTEFIKGKLMSVYPLVKKWTEKVWLSGG